MILDVVRHKFAEAILVMLLLAISAMVVALCAPVDAAALAPSVEPWRAPLQNFAVEHNIIAALLIVPLFCLSALRLARATIRISLYPAATLSAIALCSIVLLAMTSSADYFSLIIVATLACSSLGRILGCFGPVLRVQRLFSAMLFAGCMPLIDSSLLPVVAALVGLIIFVRRTLRESVISLVGALLPLFALSYIEWCFGGEFSALPVALWRDMLTPAYDTLVDYVTLPRMIFLVMLLVMQLSSSAVYISDRMSLGPGVRHAWSYLQLLFLVLVLLCIFLPSTSAALMLLTTLSVVAMLPLLYLRVPPYLCVLLFTLFLSAGCAVAISHILA